MDKKTLRERRRKKEQQLRNRQLMRLGLYGIGCLLLVIFLIRGVILPFIHFVTGGNSQEPIEVVETVTSKDDGGARRIPIKGSADSDKLLALNPGWHETEGGRWYQNPDGTYYAGGFKAIDGQQYYFNEDGYLPIDQWVTDGAKEYYFNAEGVIEPDRQRPVVALTFDDGPGQYTDRLLDCLEENGAHATFFMVGQNVGSYPDVVKRMLEIGCELGNHSWDHPTLSNLTAEQIANELDSTDMALMEACGEGATVIRPPYGAYNDAVLNIAGRPSILWCLDSLDWSYMDAELDYQEIMNKGNLTDGTIILMHDIHAPSVDCALRIIPELVQKGWRLLTISEMAEAKNVDLQNTVYTDFWESSLNSGLVAGYTGNDGMNVSVADTQTFAPLGLQTATPKLVSSGVPSTALDRRPVSSSDEEEELEEEEEEKDSEEDSEEESEDEEYEDEYSEDEEYEDEYYEEDYDESYDDEYYEEDYYYEDEYYEDEYY